MNESDREPGAQALPLAGLKVLIADDHQIVREGLKLCLKAIQQDVAICEAGTLAAAIETYRATSGIGLVLLDLNMPDTEGSATLDAFAQACPDARIVVVSGTHDMQTVQTALAKGVLGFIPKLSVRASFVTALRFVLEGGVYVPPEAFLPSSRSTAPAAAPVPAETKVATHTSTERASALRDAKLTARQIDVLAQLLDGKPNKQICRELNLALGTVKCHVSAILGALQVNSRAEAIAAADKKGWREWVAQPRQVA